MRRLALILVLSAICALPASASGAWSVRSLGQSDRALVTDGTRFAVYKSSSNKLTVIDDKELDRRYRITIQPDCEPVALARDGFLLLACDHPQPGRFRLFVLDIRHKVLTQVPEASDPPVPSQGYDPNSEGYDRIGTHWLEGIRSAAGHPSRVYLNWRTGEKRGFGEEGSYVRRDLDDPELAAVGPTRPESFDFGYDDPFSATQTKRDSEGAPLKLTLFRDGSGTSLGTKIALLDRCTTRCQSVTIGYGLVTWSRGRDAWAYIIGIGEWRSWRFDKQLMDISSGFEAVQHTRRRVYVSVYDRHAVSFALYAVRWR